MLQYIIEGGPIAMLLVLLSIVNVSVLFDRYRAFRENSKIDTHALRVNVVRLVNEHRVDEAIRLCRATPGPVSAVLLSGLLAYERFRATETSTETLRLMVNDAMSDYSLHAMSAVEKRLSVLVTIGNAAPLLGLTGTVTGMIQSFAAMGSSAGVDAAGVASGVSEALVTTAAGLIVALIAVLPYQWFNSRVAEIELEVQKGITEVVDCITLVRRQETV